MQNANGPSPINEGARGDFGGAPMVLNAEVSLPANTATVIPQGSLGAPGPIAVCDTATLQPSTRTPYWIDEIRITAVYGDLRANVNNPFINPTPLAALGVKFSAGEYALMRDFIPAILLAPRYSFRYFPEQYYDGGNVRTSRWAGEARWLLPKPLYMPAGGVLECSFQNMNIGGSNQLFSVNVTYVGRQASPGARPPSVRNVPWVGGYYLQNADKDNGLLTDMRTSGQFANPFTKELWVQRFTYFLGTRDISLINPSEQVRVPSPLVRIYDSLGYAIVPEFTPADAVFDVTRGAWTFGRSLGPREEFFMQFNTNLGFGPTYWVTPGRELALVGMIGFREESAS